MAIHVKSHRRGKSVVRAYMKMQQHRSKLLALGKASRVRTLDKSPQASKIRSVLYAKLQVGNALLGRSKKISQGGGYAMTRIARRVGRV